MKTREEIEQEYIEGCRAVWAAYEPKLDAVWAAEDAELDALNEKRKAALAELDDPMARLIAAAKDLIAPTRRVKFSHWGGDSLHSPTRFPVSGCSFCDAYAELRDAIDYAEQRKAQG